MKLTILSDNNTLIDWYFLSEPGFSAFVEDGDTRILFDTGYSGIFVENAQKMRLALDRVNYVAISHGHLDHTWGFEALIKLYTEMDIAGMPHQRPAVIAHPKTFVSIGDKDLSEIGSLLSESKLRRHFDLRLSEEPQWLTDRIVYLGQIPRTSDFEGKATFGRKEGDSKDDAVVEDSALAFKGKDGLVILTGCSHAGICNIVEYAKRVTGVERVFDIVGGFHLQKPSADQMRGTLDYFSHLDLARMHPCHCTDLKSKIALASVANVEEAGVGLALEFE